jgi:hypothetical protein
MIWTVAVLRGHEHYSDVTFARQAWLIRHVENALFVERRLDLGCGPAGRLERLRAPVVTSAAAAPVVVRRSVDRAVANRRIEPAVMRILHEIRKPQQHGPHAN